jgi:hypothetical protein
MFEHTAAVLIATIVIFTESFVLSSGKSFLHTNNLLASKEEFSFSAVNVRIQEKLIKYFEDEFERRMSEKEQSIIATDGTAEVFVIGDLEGDIGALYTWCVTVANCHLALIGSRLCVRTSFDESADIG